MCHECQICFRDVQTPIEAAPVAKGALPAVVSIEAAPVAEGALPAVASMEAAPVADCTAAAASSAPEALSAAVETVPVSVDLLVAATTGQQAARPRNELDCSQASAPMDAEAAECDSPPPDPHLVCPHQLTHTRVRLAQGQVCDFCGAKQNRSASIWHCSHCCLHACPSCRLKRKHLVEPQPQATSLVGQQVADGVPALDGESALHRDQDWEALVLEFPVHPASRTLKWVPKSLARRYAACRLRVIDWSIDAEVHWPRLPGRRVEAWSRLAQLLPLLLLREPARTATTTDDPATKASPNSIRRTLACRIRQAEEGHFAELLNEALAEEKVEATRARAAPFRERTPLQVQESAAERAEDGCLRTAARLLQGDAVLPSCPATADAVEQLYRTERCAPLPPMHKKGVRQVQAATLARRIHQIRGSAHPGPGGERNYHVRALLQSPHGNKTLLRWVNSWLKPGLSVSFKRPWMHCGMVPLDKGNGKARPIVFQEALLKLSTGAIADTTASEVRAAAGDFQMGVNHPGSTTQMVWDIRRSMLEHPDDVFTGIDCRNAFGEALRAPAMRVADEGSPTFGRLLHNLWEGTDFTIHIPDGPGSHRPLLVQDGFVQGGCEAAPAFALCLAEAVRAFQCDAQSAERRCELWAYMDDFYLRCARADWNALMCMLVARLSEVGLTCRPDKCHCFIPSATADEVAQACASYAEFASLRHDGLPVLGSAADGQYAVTLGCGVLPITEAKVRLEKAKQLARKITDLCKAPASTVRKHPGWRILDSVVNQCLSYDASVNGPGATAPLGRQLDELVEATAAEILEVRNWSPSTLLQLRLSREYGGCGLRSAADRCHTAFLAAVVRLAPAWPSETLMRIAGSDATAALAGLETAGVVLDQHAMPHRGSQPPLTRFDPILHLKEPLPKRQRSWWAVLDHQRHASVAATDKEAKVRLRSCSGPEGGAFLRATRGDGVTSLADIHFVAAVRFRLGLPVMPAGSCAHTAVKDNKTCGAGADPRGHHAVTCKIGGAPYAAHSQCCHILSEAAQQAGYQARREQVVPELATSKCSAPQLDIEGWGLHGQARLLIDFTLRHPMALRYTDMKSPTAAAANEKAAHYPARQGLHVQTAAMETYGAFGDDLTQLLETLADHARLRERSLGLAPSRWLRRWRSQLSSAAAGMVGRAVVSASERPPAVACIS